MLFKNITLVFLFNFLLFISSCSFNNIKSTNPEDLNKLGSISIENDNHRLSQIIKQNIENSFIIYKEQSSEKKFILTFTLKEKIDSSFLTDSIRRISLYVNYKLYNINEEKVVLSGSFNLKSSLGPITSLFSREQSERNGLERLAISASEEIKLRLIEWAINRKA